MSKKLYTEEVQEKVEHLETSFQQMMQAEKKAEILLYTLVDSCMQAGKNCHIDLDTTDYLTSIFHMWIKEEILHMGENATAISCVEDAEHFRIQCEFHVKKIMETMEIFSSDLFGTIDLMKLEKDYYNGETLEIDAEQLCNAYPVIYEEKQVQKVKGS